MGLRIALPDLAHWKARVKCQTGCPVATDAGRYVQLLSEGRDEQAFLVARAPNPFASVCGRVCAAPCEDVCRRAAIDAPVAIRALKRHLTEQYGVESIRPDTQDVLYTRDQGEGNRYAGHLPLTLHRTPPASAVQGAAVAVIGAGPAGLAAAHDLAVLGYRVTVFDAASEPGGMMRFGIPEYRLPRSLLRAEIDRNQQAGDAGGSAYLLVVLASITLTAVFLSIAAWIAQTSAGRAARALALALVVWFAMVILYDVAVLGMGSMLRSGTASRLLVVSALVNPVDAVRTATLIAIEGTAAFGAASLTLLRLTGGPLATVSLACLSIVVWTTVPLWLGVRRLARADI